MAGNEQDELRPHAHWRLPRGQTLLFEDFDDGILLFDSLVGATHLLSVSAAEALAIVQEFPGLETRSIHLRLLARLDMEQNSLPPDILDELLWRLEDLNLLTATTE